MAKVDPQALCERLFSTFMAPLVLGGTMKPGKPFGGSNALVIGEGRAPALEPDLLSRVSLARVRIARKLAPVDLFDPAPTGAEWAIGAMLHDLVQATHPGFDAVFRRSGPQRILTVIEKTLDRIPPPRNVGEALSRHTWFSRMFDLARTDVEVKWWTGSQTFLGTDPPGRLLAWPEVRRVQQTRTPRPLMDLPAAGSAVDAAKFAAVVDLVLRKTPLTDLATITRNGPPFMWSHEALALCSTQNGRTLVLRAFAPLPSRGVDAALGRAPRALFAARATRAILVAIDLLRDRALMTASLRLSGDKDPEPLTVSAENDDAAFALGAGALAATHWIATTGGGFGEEQRKSLLLVLGPAAGSAAAKEVRALMSG
jgi:hypothetical protein